MGFEILDNKSNYLTTTISIPSTFNMDYIVQIDQQYSFSAEVSNSRLFQLLQENNFETVHINGAEPGHHIEKIDANLCKTNVLLRHTDFFKTTILHYMLFLLQPIHSNFPGDVADNRECFFRELNNLENLDSKNRFVFAHVLLPHDPYFMKIDNDNLRNIEFNEFDLDLFIGNLELLNEKLTDILPNLIKNNPNTIIIIMSDHGFKQLYEKEGNKDIHMIKYDNFLAVYFPDNYELNNIGSNVNLFRSILGYSDENIQLLENHHFMECDFEIEKIDSVGNYTLKC